MQGRVAHLKPAFGLSGAAVLRLAGGPPQTQKSSAPRFHDFLSSSHLTPRSARLILVW